MAGSSEHPAGSGQQPNDEPPVTANGDGEAQTRDSNIPDNSSVPKPKRLACMICRRRKLKCDGVRPSCSTCSRLGHDCAYDEQRRKSGPKRGYVKALEERLKQVETLLKTQESTSAPTKTTGNLPIHSQNPQVVVPPLPVSAATNGAAALGISGDWDMDRRQFNNGESPQQPAPPLDDFNFNTNMGMNMNNVAGGDFTWEMIGLGLEEPLPAQETIDELHQVYFEKVHPSIPMIHKYRYLAAMNLPPNQRPPVCLRYAMWTMACSITDKYTEMKDLFYQRARKYVEADYIKGYGEHMISVAHCQTHILLSCYEMKMMYFPRAWINTGSAVRLAQMIGLHRQDGTGLEVKQCLPPAKDWTEREERRRTFWMAFCEDRYASIGTGWPMTIDEKDIMTNLPSSEEAFDMSRPEQTQSLQDATSPSGAGKLSPFGGVVLLASLFGRNLVHLHRPDPDDLDSDLNGPFWKRHRHMDNIILNTSLCIPAELKLPAGLSNPNVVFTNMSIHTSTICLHQAAIFKAEKNKLPSSVSAESKVRCITAANEIASIMRQVSHLDLSAMNPFISFCLYVSARVFVQYLKSRPDDSQTADSLQFLLSAMSALKRRNPLTESFLVQLDVDFEALALRIPKLRNAFARAEESAGPNPGSKQNPVCDDPAGIQGIMAYRNECQYMKANGDSGNPSTAPELVEPQSEVTGVVNGNTSSYATQAWFSGEQTLADLTPNSGTVYEKNSTSGAVSGFGDNNGDNQVASVSSEGAGSGDPTPNSSTGGAPEGRPHLTPGQMGESGRNSFQASPISPHQSIMHQGSMDASGQPFFGDPNNFAMSTAMTDQQGDFGMTGGWGDMHAQNTMPVGDGVLRALMSMGPMDAMDLSSWEAANETMRP